MKIYLMIISCFSFYYSFSQKAEQNPDSCDRNPRRCRGINLEKHIDTVTSAKFISLVDILYDKMSAGQELNLTDDRSLLLMLNSFHFAEIDKQNYIRTKYPRLILLSKMFDSAYQHRLSCKYNICTGRGLSPYYIELNVQYLGNPFACSRYYIKR
jgi:hypothetical protein